MHQPSASEPSDILILGSGLAGYSLAREIRKHRTDLVIRMLTADGGELYSKPNLSNALSQGKSARQIIQRTAGEMRAEDGLHILTRMRAEQIDRQCCTVTARAADGTPVLSGYRALVLALGADPRPLTVPGCDRVPVLTVNDLDDYHRWHQRLQTPAHVLLIGGGLIGCEFANDLRLAGHRVTLVEAGAWPLGRLVPAAVGQQLAVNLRRIGVDLHLGTGLAELKPGLACLSDGSQITFDHALSAIGLQPRIRLAEQAGLKVGRGIVVDAGLRSSDPNIYALGDCAESPAGVLPYVLPLMNQAKALAQTLCGQETRLYLRALPVSVKTPCLPTIICPPATGLAGEWRIEGDGDDLRGLFLTPDGQEAGFVLTGRHVSERQSLSARMPPLLPLSAP